MRTRDRKRYAVALRLTTMSSSVAIAVVAALSALAAIATLAYEVRRFLNGEGRYATAD